MSVQVPKGYKQTEVGVIPEDWDYSDLADLLKIKNGFAFSSSFFGKNGEILLTPGNFKLSGGLNFDERNTKYYSGIYNSSAVLEKEDLLVVMTDLTPDCNLLGKPAIVKNEEVILHNQRIGKILLSSEKITKLFLYWYFLSDRHSKRMKGTATGSTVRHTSSKSFYESKIFFPKDLEEQKSITKALSDADALIESLEQLIAKKRQIKQGAMQELLTGQRRLLGFSGEWVKNRIGNFLTFQVGFPFSSDYFNNNGDGVRLIKNRDLKNDEQIFYYTGNYSNEFLVNYGDILVGMDGDFMLCRWVKGQALLNQRVGRISVKANIDSNFIYYSLIHPLKKIEDLTSATTVKHLSSKDIENIEMLLPSLEEQTAIGTVLSEMDEEIQLIEVKLKKSREIKQSMMQELLTGRIRLI